MNPEPDHPLENDPLADDPLFALLPEACASFRRDLLAGGGRTAVRHPEACTDCARFARDELVRDVRAVARSLRREMSAPIPCELPADFEQMFTQVRSPAPAPLAGGLGTTPAPRELDARIARSVGFRMGPPPILRMRAQPVSAALAACLIGMVYLVGAFVPAGERPRLVLNQVERPAVDSFDPMTSCLSVAGLLPGSSASILRPQGDGGESTRGEKR